VAGFPGTPSKAADLYWLPRRDADFLGMRYKATNHPGSPSMCRDRPESSIEVADVSELRRGRNDNGSSWRAEL